jgi:hypothetical protein
VDEAPDPACDRAYEALLEIPSNQLKKQASSLIKIPEKKPSGNALGQAKY